MKDAMVGRIVGGRYRLETCIGSGALGRVYRARHLLIDREVAIKLLRLDRSDREDSKAWFLREARAVNRVNHPNIADIYDFGETDDGLVYLVMELLHGSPLTELIDGGPVPVPTALHIVEQMARALARAHDLGVVHRDLKPDNVFLLVNEGMYLVKLIDFGLARLMSDARLAAKGAVFGTPGYQSPEQARGDDATPQSDLYSLGVLLYEMVTGRPPYEAEDQHQLVRLHAEEEVPPPSQHLPQLDAGVESLILKLLARDLEERYLDAYHLIDDCRALQARIGPGVDEGPSRGQVEGYPVGGEKIADCVARWALRAAVLGRMVAATYPAGRAPAAVRSRSEQMWRWVAQLSQVEGELQVTHSLDHNLRQREREFVDQMGSRIEELSRTRSSLHRELSFGRKEQRRRRRAYEETQKALGALHANIRRVETGGQREQLWALLQEAGATAARGHVHLEAIALVDQKIAKWQRTIERTEDQAQKLRQQIDRHAERVEKDLELGRPRYASLLQVRQTTLRELEVTSAFLVSHFEARPECAPLLRELAALAPSMHEGEST